MADNPYYRPYGDPAIARGFDDLAKAFVPSAQDIYAGVKAREAQQKMRGVDELYRIARDPASRLQDMDKWGVAANIFNPTQSTYAVDQGNFTKRRGDDLQLEGTKYGANASAGAAIYGHNKNYDAHIFNTNEVAKTNRRGQDIDATTKTNVALMNPLNTGQTQYIPPDVASLYNVPGQRSGIVETKPGEIQYLPGAGGAPGAGGTLQGGVKPLSLEEVKAATFQGLPRDTQEAIVFGPTPIQTVPGADGKPPVPKTGPQVLAGGVAPIDTKHAPQPFNYRTPDGKTGVGMIENGIPVDATTKQPLPQGIAGQHFSGVQSKDPLGSTTANMTAANSKAAQLKVFNSSLDAFEDLLKKNPGIIGIPGSVRGAAQNALSVAQEFTAAFGKMSPMAKITEDHVSQFANAVGANSRDPAISQARVMKLDLAYKLAQMENPQGEVSRQAFERALSVVDGGTLQNNQSALEAVGALRGLVAREHGSVDALRDPKATGPTVIPTARGNVTIERIP